MLRKNSNITVSLLGKASVTAASLPAVGAKVTPANLPIGALVLTDIANNRISSLSAGQDFFIVQGCGSDKPLLRSRKLNQSRIVTTVAGHRSAKQQITIIGYNPATGTGALNAANNTSYFIKIRKNDPDMANQSQPMSLFAQFTTDASATQRELAYGLLANGNKNFGLELGNGYLKLEVVSDGTAAAIGTTTLAATNGDKLLTYSAAHSLAIGDLVFIAGATYEVKSVPSTTTVVLSTEFKGTTVSALATGTTYASTHGKLTSVTNYGIRITGIENKFDVNKFRNYYSNRFTATFSDTTVMKHPVQGASDGVGVWQKVALDEYMTFGFEGQMDQLAVPATPRYQFVQSAATNGGTDTNKYSAMEIAVTEEVGGITSFGKLTASVIVYLNLDQTSPNGVVPAGSAEAALITALGGTVSDYNQVS